jgi:outer membrane protein TolC
MRGKTIDADTAVQVALLNNRGLQAAYAEIGLSAADVWQQYLLVNPNFRLEMTGIGAPGVGIARTIEGAIITNIMALITRPHHIDIAKTRFRQAQLEAALETLSVAATTRRAWINAVSAWERVTYLNLALAAADAASELAEELGRSGALPKGGQAREHVFYAELTGQAAQARLAAKGAKEELIRLMGVWGRDLEFFVPDALPSLPEAIATQRAIEAEALRKRVDLQIATLELERLAKDYGLTEAMRYLNDFEILTGVEIEHEVEDDGDRHVKSGKLEVEFEIPIFDSGEARLRKAELAYMQAANRLAEKAVNVRSEARSAYDAYRGTFEIARHYRSNVVPLRAEIEEQSVLSYSGMITNTFELLADTRAKIDSILLSLDAKRAFWLADAGLGASVYGGESAAAAEGMGAVAVATPKGADH